MELMSSPQPDRVEMRVDSGSGHGLPAPPFGCLEQRRPSTPDRRDPGSQSYGRESSHSLLPLTQGSEQLHTTIFAFKKDCVVVSVIGPAHPNKHDLHCSWRRVRKDGWAVSVKAKNLSPSVLWRF